MISISLRKFGLPECYKVKSDFIIAFLRCVFSLLF